MENNLYVYKAKVLSIYDCDTIRLQIDLGFGIAMSNESIRLYGINSPEVRGEERDAGLVARDWLRDKILGKDIILESIKGRSGKYGRLLGIVYLDGVNINDLIVTTGHGVYKNY